MVYTYLSLKLLFFITVKLLDPPRKEQCINYHSTRDILKL